jgi:hypothetical protein
VILDLSPSVHRSIICDLQVNVLKPVDGKLVAKAPTQHQFVNCLQTLTGIHLLKTDVLVKNNDLMNCCQGFGFVGPISKVWRQLG